MANIIYGQELRKKLWDSADKIDRLTAPNFGPEGRRAICEQEYDLPVIANSGRKVLEDFCLYDRGDNIAAALIRDAGKKIADQYGDGNMTTVILADALVRSGIKLITAGYDPMRMRKGIHRMLSLADSVLDEMVIPFDDELLERFVMASGKEEEVGKYVLEACRQVGADGVVTVQDSQRKDTALRFWDGARYDCGLFSIAFAQDKEKKHSVLQNPRVLLSNVKIQSFSEIRRILEEARQAKTPLLIITYDMSEDVQALLAANSNRKTLQVVVAKAPGFGDSRRRNMLALAAKTGSVLIDENTGLKLEDCGLDICAPVRYAKIEKENTVLQGFSMSARELVEKLRKHTGACLAETTDADEREKLQTTLSILNGKTAEIQVGAAVEYEMFEKKYLYENTLRAVRNAAKSNLVPGAGNAFFWLGERLRRKADDLPDAEKTGALCLCDALETLIRRLAESAGISAGKVPELVRQEGDPYHGYDIRTYQIVDLREKGILMPRNTAEAIVKTAAETAASLWTVEAAVLADR